MASAAERNPGWQFAVRAEANGDIELDIYDVIGPDDAFSLMYHDRVSAKGVKETLKASTAANISVRINSAGGDVFEGMAIYELLRGHSAKVSVKVDGLCASIASIIAMAGDEIVMGEGTWMMIHKPYSAYSFEQRAEDLRSQAEMLDKLTDSMASIYAKRTGLSEKDCIEKMQATTWMTAAEALELGFCTKVEAAKGGDDEPIPEASSSVARALLKDFKRVPAGAFMAMARAHGERLMNIQANAKPPARAEESAKAEDDELAKAKKKIAELEDELDKAKKSKAKAKDDEDGDEPEETGGEEMKALAQAALKLTGKKTPAEAEGAIMALGTRLESLTSIEAEVRAMKREKHVARISGLIAQGKLLPIQKEWALAADEKVIDAYVASLGDQTLAPIGVEHQPGTPPVQATTRAQAALDRPLSKEERVLMQQMNMTEADVKAARKIAHDRGYPTA